MPKVQKALTEQLYELVHEFANKVVDAARSVTSSALPTEDANQLNAEIDRIVIQEYNPVIEGVKEMEQFNHNRTVLASQFDVDPSEVTDAFLNNVLEEARREAKNILSQHATRVGIKLKPDTPEYRESLMKRVQRIIEASPK